SRFVKDPDAVSPGDELRRAKAVLQSLYRLFPQVLVCESNHALRPYKRAQEAGLPATFLRTWREVLGAPPGWRWASRWRRSGVTFLHGDGFTGKNGAWLAAQRNRCSTVIGHLHAYGGVLWEAGLEDAIFGMNVGCLIDTEAVAFAYARHLAARPTL